MIYKVRLIKWLDDSVSIVSKEELSNLHTKKYHAYVKDVFTDHQMNHGQDEQEALDAFSSQNFSTVETFLIKSGYDLENGFLYDSGK